MRNSEIKFEVGQVWYYEDNPEFTYEVYEIEPLADEYIVRTYNYNNRSLVGRGHFTTDENCKASYLGDRWRLLKAIKPKLFTRISARTLRKRQREQMAATSLTDKT